MTGGAYFRVGIGGQKSEQLMLALDGIGFRATPAVPCRPDASEEGERTVFVECKPGRGLARLAVRVFAEGIERNDAAVLDIQPGTPMRARRVADVGDRRPAKLRRARHAPARQHEFAHAVRRVANNRRGLVREDAGYRRQIAGPIAHGPTECDDRCLSLGDRIEIAHQELS
jgi:hypothetical protein